MTLPNFIVIGTAKGGTTALYWYLAEHPEVVAENFPGYAPDLNPDEGVWGWTKYGRLANLAANDKSELWDHVVEELITVKHRPDLLRGFIQQTGLPGISLAA